MSKKRFYLSTVAGFAALLAAGSASAASISYYLNNPIGGGEPHPLGNVGNVGSISALTDVSTGLQFQRFNTSLGTLTSIKVDLFLDYATILKIINGSASSSSGNGNTRITAKETFASGAIGLNIYAMPSFTYGSLAAGATVTANMTSTGDFTLNGGDGGPVSISRLLTNTTDLMAYQNSGGSGFNSIPFITLTDTQLSNTGGATSATQSTHFDVDGQITYTYTPALPPGPVGVPEPMTAAVLMAGLAGLAGIRRRR
jgi:hypothetical protein